MGAVKNHFHDEICAMSESDDPPPATAKSLDVWAKGDTIGHSGSLVELYRVCRVFLLNPSHARISTTLNTSRNIDREEAAALLRRAERVMFDGTVF